MFRIEYMQRALILGEKGRGHVSPNPLVGCVIVKNDRIIGEGWHKKYGENHAEINALENCIESPEGSEVYVTLEPCSHTGKTPPCAHRLVKEHVQNVFIGTIDPNPEVSGRGIKILKDAGINVEVGFLEDRCRQLNTFFFHRIHTGLPYIILKMAVSLDGYIADETGSSKWISSEDSRREVHELRSRVDAVLVGSGTVRSDNPMLDVRLVEGRNPQKIVLDFSAGLTPNYTVFDKNTILVAQKSKITDQYRREFEKKQVTLLETESKKGEEFLKLFAKMGLSSILVEGGAVVSGMFAEEMLIDEMVVYKAPFILGGGKPMFRLTENRLMNDKLEFKGKDTKICLQGLLRK